MLERAYSLGGIDFIAPCKPELGPILYAALRENELLVKLRLPVACCGLLLATFVASLFAFAC